jgi:hypothetical protein
VALQEFLQRLGARALLHFPQHPAHGLVDEIVTVTHPCAGDAHGVFRLAPADEVERGDDGNAAETRESPSPYAPLPVLKNRAAPT